MLNVLRSFNEGKWRFFFSFSFFGWKLYNSQLAPLSIYYYLMANIKKMRRKSFFLFVCVCVFKFCLIDREFFSFLSFVVIRYTWIDAYSSSSSLHSICHRLLIIKSTTSYFYFMGFFFWREEKTILSIIFVDNNYHHVHFLFYFWHV